MDIQLYPDEVIVHNEIFVYKRENPNSMSAIRGGLILTNKAVIWVNRNRIFGNSPKEVVRIPLNTIKVWNDKVQVIVDDSFDGFTICHAKGSDYFSNLERSEIKEFGNKLNELVTGNPNDIFKDANAIPGIKKIAQTIRGSIDAFKEGIAPKTDREAVVTECKGCGAQISGYKGNIATCGFCGTKNKL